MGRLFETDARYRSVVRTSQAQSSGDVLNTWFNSFPDAMAERQRTINLHPVKKIGTVEEVGALCVYLASPMAGFISGTTILMDGGRSALMQDS